MRRKVVFLVEAAQREEVLELRDSALGSASVVFLYFWTPSPPRLRRGGDNAPALSNPRNGFDRNLSLLHRHFKLEHRPQRLELSDAKQREPRVLGLGVSRASRNLPIMLAQPALKVVGLPSVGTLVVNGREGVASKGTGGRCAFGVPPGPLGREERCFLYLGVFVSSAAASRRRKKHISASFFRH